MTQDLGKPDRSPLPFLADVPESVADLALDWSSNPVGGVLGDV